MLFNIVIFVGPLFLGLHRLFRFKYWFEALFSIIIVMIPYIVWDAAVTGKHWLFNSDYILGIYLTKLPIEEWLFFITVPFACLFTWEMIVRNIKDRPLSIGKYVYYMQYIFPIIAVLFFTQGKQYTGLVMIFLSLAIFMDSLMKTDLLMQKRFYLYLSFIILFTLIFNGYLTWRPVVLYGEFYQLDFRVFTIPIEDFGYGLSLLYFNTILYEKLKTRKMNVLKIANI